MRPRLLFLLLAALAASFVDAAAFPPNLRFQTLAGERISLHFHDGLEPLARQALALSQEILDRLEARYGVRVGPRLHIVLSDVDDRPNGLASPLPYPLVQVRVAAPAGDDVFGRHDGWLRLVLTHELTHVVHLEPARGLPGFGRKLLGRAPYLFPNTLSPTWLVEGLATLEETDGTASGRGRSSDSRMSMRAAALADDFLHVDEALTGLDRWPGGDSAYLFGEAFLRDVQSREGEQALPEVVRVHSGRVIPFLDDLTAKKVTGRSFSAQWRDWSQAQGEAVSAEADALEAAGLSASEPLTTRGIRQLGPRVSPDGALVAYTSGTLDHYREIRLMGRDGSGDRGLATRNGGASASWTPDGREIVYDELEIHERFSTFSDLRIVDVATGARRRLTRGQRASQPDVSPDGRVVFVRRVTGGSELAAIGLDGTGPVDLTHSAAGTEWSAPRWSPDGGRLAAARLDPEGVLDVVLVDADAGQVTAVTDGRARNLEPAWTPDGEHLVIRSDRDGISNLYVVRLADRQIRRFSRVPGGAFQPEVTSDGAVFFASYSAAGYDIHSLARRFDPRGFAELEPAPESPGTDAAIAAPPPFEGEAGSYRPLPSALPRFWTPWAARYSNEWRFGIATAGADPLLRHAWATALHYGEQTERVGVQALYQYDRWRPTFLVAYEDLTEPASDGELRTRTTALRATLPLQRRLRFSQDASLTWRGEREELEHADGARQVLDLGGLELAWSLGNVRRFPYSVSPVEGFRFRIAGILEDPALGSDVSLVKLTTELRGYTRVFGGSDALALRGGYGTTFGEPQFERSFAIGGFPGGSLRDLLDTNLALLRGYPDDAFRGRNVAYANAEYRVPLGHPQRGWSTFPAFVRHVHASVFFDAAQTWNEEFRLEDVKTGAGAALGFDLIVGNALPLTLMFGYAHGFDELGEDQVYFRTGLSF